jgi:hypothetical protein
MTEITRTGGAGQLAGGDDEDQAVGHSRSGITLPAAIVKIGSADLVKLVPPAGGSSLTRSADPTPWHR